MPTVVIPHEELTPGDVILYRDLEVDVLRAGEPGEDPFGRPITRYWCRVEDDQTREGFMDYGPGGVAVVMRDDSDPCPECREPMAAVYVGADGVGVCARCRA